MLPPTNNNQEWINVDATRLDKFEKQLDIIVARLETLVRLEERHDGAVKRIDRQERLLDRHSERLDAVEQKTNSNTSTTNVFERGAWVVFAAVLSAVTFLITHVGG